MSVGFDLDAILAKLTTALDALTGRVDKLEAVPAPQPPVPPPVPVVAKLGAVSYYYPGVKWDTLLARRPAIAMINPASGPGLAANASYVTQVAKATAAGATVLGYVYSSYAARPLVDVQADIDKHVLFYGVKGIFLDEVSNSDNNLPYYQSVCAYAHSKGLKICLNPGTKTTEGYAKAADWLMVAETSIASYRTRTAAAWESLPAYAGKCWHVVHSCPPADMPAAVAIAKAQAAGLIWVTDDVLPNPYDTNPSYLDALVAELVK